MTTKRRKLTFTNAVALFLVCILLIRILDGFSLPDGLIIGNNDGPDEVKAAALDCNKTVSNTSPDGATSTTPDDDDVTAVLQSQIQIQKEFQELIRINQHPLDCQKRRVLLTPARAMLLDGFTLELQYYGRYLQSGMALDRTFLFRNNFKSAYAPGQCRWPAHHHAVQMKVQNQWDCLYEPVSNCTEDSVLATAGDNDTISVVNATVMGAYGIINHKSSPYFHTGYYGNQRVIENLNLQKKTQYVDTIEHWERAMGRFWIRAQMVHYLWKPSVGLQSEMQLRLPKDLLLGAAGAATTTTPYIGMHIRFTDNVANLWKDFGRNANETRSLSHIMEIAQEIRAETGISTIYLATDSIKTLQALQDSSYNNAGWSFVVQQNVPRSAGTEWTWFKQSRGSSAAAIATDVEVLRRADYLIGSFQSNVYRLVAELNTAYHVGKYPLHRNRHRTVDVEWYEDP